MIILTNICENAMFSVKFIITCSKSLMKTTRSMYSNIIRKLKYPKLIENFILLRVLGHNPKVDIILSFQDKINAARFNSFCPCSCATNQNSFLSFIFSSLLFVLFFSFLFFYTVKQFSRAKEYFVSFSYFFYFIFFFYSLFIYLFIRFFFFFFKSDSNGIFL